MTTRKTTLEAFHIALCAAIFADASPAAAPAQPAKVASFAGGNETDVGRSAAGDSFPLNRLAVWPQGAGTPAFELVDTEGMPRTLSDYRGHVAVVVFGFMHCPDACPAELFKLALVMKQLGQAAAHVQVLFITLDPERDTPPSLKKYVSAFDPRFIGLTGTTAQVDQAASGFNVQYARVPLGNDYTIDHSTAIFLFDGAGRLRRIGATNSPVADFVHDITELVAKRP
jgi:protein SCO1